MSKTKSYTYLMSFGILSNGLFPTSTGRCVHTTNKPISTAQDIHEVEKSLHELLDLSSRSQVALYSFSLMSEEVSNDD